MLAIPFVEWTQYAMVEVVGSDCACKATSIRYIDGPNVVRATCLQRLLPYETPVTRREASELTPRSRQIVV